MFDGKSKKALWRGTASGTLQDDPARMTAMLQAALDKMFAGFRRHHAGEVISRPDPDRSAARSRTTA